MPNITSLWVLVNIQARPFDGTGSKSSYYVLLSANNILLLFAVMRSIGIPRFNREF